MKKLPKHKITPVQETMYGVYVWITDNNEIVQDQDGNYLSIQAHQHDLEAITALSKAARYWGVPGGKPLFLDGRRKVTDEEYEIQKARAAAGMTPDIYDVGAIKDDIRAARDKS